MHGRTNPTKHSMKLVSSTLPPLYILERFAGTQCIEGSFETQFGLSKSLIQIMYMIIFE
jgi:hypothetical protein